jgi:glycosyltransferase involved in cell wall biosynthesis
MQVFVIPAFNEEENLPRLLHDLEDRPMLWSGGHVILVDDGSSDGTVAVAQAYDARLTAASASRWSCATTTT